ncbi:2-dehydro-3-deoxyphosphooctonate aldolase [Candidatus Protochlamydia naegleriophila]|uniref:2-dehydro-3-deoxyphosphooctonate aldolase n=1 Tax=Candidatus Protochlamydia naegleriophila TaxID=389348 RepID=A0A0U5J7I2_9BACT|nr:3-deoxy-8-phosphooctulonate synthase [Candidatus Protochlamydia naegleriophila]CUI16041.1 2-dehydro-3-deoxyphosphooctonate aldolase [Candidatus Protochlamydia naegleriophila]
MHRVIVKNFAIGPKEPLVVMSGPCVIESEAHCLQAAETLKKMFEKHGVQLIFKSSYDKANRSAFDSFRGPGLEEGLRILERVQKEFDLPVVTDVHSPEEARAVGSVCEIIQIPAFLCRQTDLIFAAAETGAVVSVKKGQFLAPWDMENVVNKITSLNNHKIILVDRGTTFGYNNLVSDMRGIPIMQSLGYPVCYDATHAVQKPGGLGSMSGGDRQFIPVLAKAALAAGANCLFIESHPNPAQAKSDAASVMDFKDLDRLLPQFKQLYELIQQQE